MLQNCLIAEGDNYGGWSVSSKYLVRRIRVIVSSNINSRQLFGFLYTHPLVQGDTAESCVDTEITTDFLH